MNKLLVIVSVLFFISCKSNEQSSQLTSVDQPIVNNKYSKNIQFIVKQIKPYCGGARPLQEMEERRLKGEPEIDYVFYVEDSTGFLKRLKTNEFGMINMVFKYGNYCIKEGYKVDPKMKADLAKSNWEFDQKCIDQWTKSCNEKFTVSAASVDTVYFENRLRCDFEGPIPCITNTGFPPP